MERAAEKEEAAEEGAPEKGEAEEKDGAMGQERLVAAAPEAPARMSLPARLLAVFLNPGRLMEELAEDPRWIGALLAGAVLVGLSVALLPVELFLEMNREAAIERGADLPEMGERAVRLMRIVIPVGTVLSTLFFMGLFAGLYTVVFAFVLGDEGTFRQYLAALSHAYFIPAVFGLLVTPLRIGSGDPQLTLNLASFFAFLPDGYLLNVLRVFDLTQIWSTLVIAQGAHAIDKRRSFGSAAAILLTFFTLFALVLARFM